MQFLLFCYQLNGTLSPESPGVHKILYSKYYAGCKNFVGKWNEFIFNAFIDLEPVYVEIWGYMYVWQEKIQELLN